MGECYIKYFECSSKVEKHYMRTNPFAIYHTIRPVVTHFSIEVLCNLAHLSLLSHFAFLKDCLNRHTSTKNKVQMHLRSWVVLFPFLKDTTFSYFSSAVDSIFFFSRAISSLGAKMLFHACQTVLSLTVFFWI